MVGIQAWFAALVIRLFGFSFTAVRLTTAVFAVGCALILFKLGRRIGLNPSYARLGTLAVVLSPIFVPLAASFMTDVPAFFFLLACAYCGVRALDAVEWRTSVWWLTLAAISGLLGGTVRQVVWGAPLSMIPAVAWSRRADRRIAAAAVALSAVVLALVVAGMQWLSRQPFFEWDPRPQTAGELLTIVQHPLRFAGLMRTGLLLVLPVLALYFFGWWRVRRWRILVPGVVVFGALWVVDRMVFREIPFPFGNLVTFNGVLYSSTEAIGSKPIVLSQRVLEFLAFASLAAAAACVIGLLHASEKSDPSPQRLGSTSDLWLLCAPFCLGYLLLLGYRARFGDLFDRYLLLVLPVVNLPLLHAYQQRLRAHVPAVGWLLVGLFAAYGVATTHDYISAARARLAAATALMRAGVPRTEITAGLEFDGWTEIEASGHINSELIRVPATAHVVRSPRQYPGVMHFGFSALTPSIEPQYFVVYSRQRGLVDTSYPPVVYQGWLPFSRRTVFTQRLAERSDHSPQQP
jgi:hypothetical protein